jgi:hypothetical protein
LVRPTSFVILHSSFWGQQSIKKKKKYIFQEIYFCFTGNFEITSILSKVGYTFLYCGILHVYLGAPYAFNDISINYKKLK